MNSGNNKAIPYYLCFRSMVLSTNVLGDSKQKSLKRLLCAYYFIFVSNYQVLFIIIGSIINVGVYKKHFNIFLINL